MWLARGMTLPALPALFKRWTRFPAAESGAVVGERRRLERRTSDAVRKNNAGALRR